MAFFASIAATGFFNHQGSEIPLIVNLAMPSYEHQILINPATLGIAVDNLDGDHNVSAVELEACGLAPSKACETINKLMASLPLKIDNHRTMSALQNLYHLSSIELDFEIHPSKLSGRGNE